MRVLICGGRDFTDSELFEKIMDEYVGKITTVIHGSARGADTLGHLWGLRHNLEILEYPANWNYGKSAGPIRNAQMLTEGKPEIVIAFPGGKGTQNMIDQAKKAGIPVEVIEI